MLRFSYFIDRLISHFHDMKAVMNDLLFSQRDVRFRALQVCRAHVGRDRLNAPKLLFRGLRECNIRCLSIISV